MLSREPAILPILNFRIDDEEEDWEDGFELEDEEEVGSEGEDDDYDDEYEEYEEEFGDEDEPRRGRRPAEWD